MFFVVQPYGRARDYKDATVVASLPTAVAAWEYLDSLHEKMAAGDVQLDFVDLVVVDEQRALVPRPSTNIN
jgi:RecA/RadA recombinase